MPIDSRSRKWQITINNPAEHGFTHDKLIEQLSLFSSLVYWCMCDEIGESGTYHTHVFMALDSASRFSTIKSRFDGAHIEMANGTSQQNRDYIRKEGKYLKSKKKETNLSETFEEYGEMPVERQGARNDLADLYDMIKQGMSNFEIVDQNPQYMMNVDKIERIRQTIRENKYKSIFRDVVVTYVFGESGTGKTRTIMEQYGYENVYRVTDYAHPFDSYSGQSVLVFEEFRSGLRVQDMLNYLDGYPLELPCRYANKIACFDTVYIVSNIDLCKQYPDIQKEHPETWDAFCRRIRKVNEYTTSGVTEYESVTAFLNRFDNEFDLKCVQTVFDEMGN